MIEYFRYFSVIFLIGAAVYIVHLGTQRQSIGAAVNISATGTSTFPNGLNLTTGCFTMAGGSCVSALSGYERVSNTASLDTTNNNQTTATVDCSAGKKVVGGGMLNGSDAYVPQHSRATDDDTWSVTTRCESTALGTCSAGDLTAYAICATF